MQQQMQQQRAQQQQRGNQQQVVYQDPYAGSNPQHDPQLVKQRQLAAVQARQEANRPKQIPKRSGTFARRMREGEEKQRTPQRGQQPGQQPGQQRGQQQQQSQDNSNPQTQDNSNPFLVTEGDSGLGDDLSLEEQQAILRDIEMAKQKEDSREIDLDSEPNNDPHHNIDLEYIPNGSKQTQRAPRSPGRSDLSDRTQYSDEEDGVGILFDRIYPIGRSTVMRRMG